jgi:putative transposase
MKLDKRKIHWIIRQEQKGATTKPISLDMKISRRRVQQIWKGYVESKQEPAVGENLGRPSKPFDEREAEAIGEAYQIYRFGARMLEVAVRKVFKIRISHNRIQMYLKAADLSRCEILSGLHSPGISFYKISKTLVSTHIRPAHSSNLSSLE